MLHGQVGQKLFDFEAIHLSGMPFVMEEDEAFDPVDVSLFGANRIMFGPHGVPNLIQQPGGLFC